MKTNVIYLPSLPPPVPPPPSPWSLQSILARCRALLSRSAAFVSRTPRPSPPRPARVPAVAAPRRPRRPARVINLDQARARLRPPAPEVTAVAAE